MLPPQEKTAELLGRWVHQAIDAHGRSRAKIRLRSAGWGEDISNRAPEQTFELLITMPVSLDRASIAELHEIHSRLVRAEKLAGTIATGNEVLRIELHDGQQGIPVVSEESLSVRMPITVRASCAVDEQTGDTSARTVALPT